MQKEAKGPGTMVDLMGRFPDEATCVEFLRKLRWPDGLVCPRCGARESVTIQTRRLEQCRSCRYQASLTAGTVFHRTRKPLRLWFLAIFLYPFNEPRNGLTTWLGVELGPWQEHGRRETSGSPRCERG